MSGVFRDLHKPQLISSGVPEIFWDTLERKLSSETFDAGDAFSLMLIDYGDDNRSEESPVWSLCVSKADGIQKDDGDQVYLIDHAWTFGPETARNQLETTSGLIERMTALMGIARDNDTELGIIEQILTRMWRYCNMYTLGDNSGSSGNCVPIWFIMDEVGSAIIHNDDPNFRVVPFFHFPDQTMYSVLFPIRDSGESDMVTSDFVEGISKGSPEREVLLLPWRYRSFIEEPYLQSEPDASYFLSGHVDESLPEIDTTSEPQIDANRPLRVYAEYDVLRTALTDPSFEIVEDEADADILWLTRHFKTYSEFSEQFPNKFINQFPFENVVTIKDLLAIVCRRSSVAANESPTDCLDIEPAWLPTTFNLKTELRQFVSYFQRRSRLGLDNHWICKPWNLARGLDTHVTGNLTQIIRLARTGPKIVQKYIDRPVLFDRPEIGGKVKFDIRYVVLLKSVQPLDAYIYTNFFLRFANKPFGLSQFDDYEMHFTVMNYAPDFVLRHIKCDEFRRLWHEQYPDHNWQTIEQAICDMLHKMLVGATAKPPPCGIAPSHQSRAVYAMDIMLEWTCDDRIQPKLLETNWTPDCKRACDYYPSFYNDIFKLLFLDLDNPDVFRSIVVN